MNLFVRFFLLFAVLGQMVLLSACSAWKPQRLEATTVEQIDKRLSSQMPLAAFRSEFPKAVRVDGDDANGSWLVYVQSPCFWCRTAEGFERSEDVYARIVRFEGGRLTGIEAVEASR